MNDGEYLGARNRRMLMLLVFFMLIPVNILLYQTYPVLARWLPIVMMALGGSLFLFGLVSYGCLPKVYDYEPTTLWGRPTNGKQARMVLQNLGIAGMLLVILGIFSYAFFQ